MFSMLAFVLNIFLVFGLPSTFAADLRGSLKSLGFPVSFPGDADYTSASSPFNLRFTFKPAAVAFPKTPQEVSTIVKIGNALKLRVVARSGGHSYIANGLGGKDGALVVDLRNLGNITIDDAKGTAVIETGNRLGDIAAALGEAGKALPHGTCSYVGIGGHAAYGGFGFTSRMWGLTLDAITAVNAVLSNGTIIRATNQQYADLFWGLRGSASSFGITTSIEVTTFPSPPSATIFAYSWDGLNVTTASNAIEAFQSFVQTNIPPYIGGEINMFKGPVSGTVSLSLVGGWYAPVDNLNATLDPFLRQMPTAVRVSQATGSYLDSAINLAGGSLDTKSNPDGNDTFYAKSLMTPENSPMSKKAISAFMNYLATEGFNDKVNWFFQMELYGGKNSAINAVAPDATAFAHRDSIFNIHFYASSPNNVSPYPQFGFTFLDGVVQSIVSNSPPNWAYGAYINYVDDRLVDWQKRYYSTHYARLQSLKMKYDPKDVFAFPTAIEE